MGAPCSHARKAGSGTIHRKNDRYEAVRPAQGGQRRGASLGWYPSRHEAMRALEAWLRQNQKCTTEGQAFISMRGQTITVR